MAQPRLNKADTTLAEKYAFSFQEPPPPKKQARGSKLDAMWEAAKELCKKYPGQSLKVRTYNAASQASADTTRINQNKHRSFNEELGDKKGEWHAVNADSDDPTELMEDNTPQRVIYLTYNPAQDTLPTA